MHRPHREHITLSVFVFFLSILLLGLDPYGFVQARVRRAKLSFANPVLTYSTTFGRGSGEVREVAVDATGNIIIAGSTGSRTLFPLINAADDTYGESGKEGFVTKISASGDELIYSTYLGEEFRYQINKFKETLI